MSTMNLSMTYPFFPYEDEIRKKFSAISRRVLLGDRIVFDKFCQKIYPFCLEIRDIGKDLVFSHKPIFADETRIETPTDCLIQSVGENIGLYVLPIYKNYLTKSDALYEMVSDVLDDETLVRGRVAFIRSIWHKTKRTEGINIKKLLSSKDVACHTAMALLKLKDGRFVKEVRKLPKLTPDTYKFYKKKIDLYIERYGGDE